MSALVVSSDAVVVQLQSLKLLVAELRRDVRDLRAENLVLRQENTELRQQVRDLTREVGYWKSRHADVKNKNVLVQAELDQAKAETRQLKAERFGKSSEKQKKVDRSNDLADPQKPVDPDTPGTERKKRGQQPDRPAPKRRDRSHLPVRVEVIDLPDEEKVCGCCGLPLTDLGCSKDSEQIEIEIELYRKQLERKRYRRTCNCVEPPRTVTAPMPPKLLPKSIFGTSIWVYLLIEKFQLQRPTHRSIEQLRLLGLRLAPGTIADGFKRIESLLTPIYEALRRHHVKSRFFHADEKLRAPCRTALTSLQDHWSGLTLFVDEPRIPMDNNAAERKIRNPAVGRKNYYGSGAEWAGRLAMMLFSIFATLAIWKINPRTWLTWYFDACATNAGRAPENVEIFMPWNLSAERLAELRNPHGEPFPNTS